MATASIKNMMFYGFHGYYEYEREQGQKFYLDVTVDTKDDTVCNTDDIKDGVDVAAVYDIVKDVTENKRFTTLSALCAHIGDPPVTSTERDVTGPGRHSRIAAAAYVAWPANCVM